MRAKDVINEATEEGIDVVNIAKYVSSFLLDHGRFGIGYDIGHMENQKPLPDLYTEAAYSMLYDHGLMFAIVKSPKTPKGTVHLGAYVKGHKLIWINQRTLRDFGLLTSVLVHELQHALDDIRSEGRALPKFGTDYTRAQYLARPQEINARFSQAMYDIVNHQADYIKAMGSPWDRKESKEMIQRILRTHNLDRKVFPDGPRGQKAYKRILSRAYTFNADISKAIRPGDDVRKPSIMDRIKLLIRSYLPF